ncbi:ATP phosphoribosyltransferase [Candidatus Kaiserbacteria bacterium CG10_big_fil_rev_8_21_14_0_10_51_14]|uniref:ATP phosphoribosyltransferase n=1 Tax=Candidatus Kaiserbacteria bacterium CG10_big_fil_rev_8_21_14_0_10_51_14 TaxID=1974610 RepID=A0A2H0UB31_9BACT|nr:MAG: ATP phosphoribosyltransferase [Candidatus Kaiserbacteria bacterium CG10_big_fil_rev_8_21_14_0_10_51_14]
MNKAANTIALPEGKNLGPQTLELLEGARIKVRRKHPRAIEGSVEGLPYTTRAIFCRPEQVKELVGSGLVLFGITGKDIVLESPNGSVEILEELPYSRSTQQGTRCVFFTQETNPVSTVTGMLQDCDRADRDEFGRLGIASEYPEETRAFIAAKGNARIPIVPCSSAEVMVYTRQYRYGACLVETGTTLTVNGLKEMRDDRIFDSCAVLIGNENLLDAEAPDFDTYRSRAHLLGSLLRGTLEARELVYLVMNAPKSEVEAIRQILPALKSPTIQPLADPDFCSIAAVVPAWLVNGLILRLSNCRAMGFVTLPPSTVM